MGKGTRLTYPDLIRRVTATQHTKDFRHLLPLARVYRKSRRGPTPAIALKVAPVRDRIKWWNVVAGDQVGVMADDDRAVREVLAVDKLCNRVFVKRDAADDKYAGRNVPARNLHYSGIRLYLGHYQFPSSELGGEPQSLPVFAKRLGTSAPVYRAGRWAWQRFATATDPPLPGSSHRTKIRELIPWPKEIPPLKLDPKPYDTSRETVLDVTYNPPSVPSNTQTVSLSTDVEDQYLANFKKGLPDDPTFFMEFQIARELANPHSRGRKRERWHAKQARNRAMLKELTKVELADLQGRTHREAKIEAEFRWKQKLEEERKAEMKKRMVQRGVVARLRKKERKRKERMALEAKRLRDLVLRNAPNQVVPQLEL